MKHSTVENQKRAEAGLPVLTCPNCGEEGGRHWMPAQLSEAGRIVQGFFTCKAAQ